MPRHVHSPRLARCGVLLALGLLGSLLGAAVSPGVAGGIPLPGDGGPPTYELPVACSADWSLYTWASPQHSPALDIEYRPNGSADRTSPRASPSSPPRPGP
jgi:hypothetical protein